MRARVCAYYIRLGGDGVSFAEAIKTCFQKYAEFRGRAARPEFWWFFLLYYILIVAPLGAADCPRLRGLR